MASYWKFAYLLVPIFAYLNSSETDQHVCQRLYCHSLLDRYRSCPIILENEPKLVDIEKLTSFKGTYPHAKKSILESFGILHSKEHGYSVAGKEVVVLADLEQPNSDKEASSATLNSKDSAGQYGTRSKISSQPRAVDKC